MTHERRMVEGAVDTAAATPLVSAELRRRDRSPLPAALAFNGSPRLRKVRATFYLPAELVDELKDAVVHLSGPPLRLTLASLAESAFFRELERLRQVENAGTRFPRRAGPLRGGRPIGS
jgi:hypothetical protein